MIIFDEILANCIFRHAKETDNPSSPIGLWWISRLYGLTEEEIRIVEQSGGK